jgi:hypothetical protein
MDGKNKDAMQQLLVVLQREINDATKSGDLDRAIKIRDLSKQIQSGVASNGTKPVQHGKAMAGSIVAAAEASFILYVNGNRVLDGSNNGSVATSASVKLAIGDVITVRAIKGGYGQGFACLCLFPEAKRQIVTNTSTWKSYTPKNALRWYDPAGTTEETDAKLGRDTNVGPAVAKLVTADEQAIWGTGDTTYLKLTITEDVIQELTATPPKGEKK